jgi:hypothetical protein
MREPDKTFRGKRLDAMSVAELQEMREWTISNGYHFPSRDALYDEVTIIDEHIAAAKRRAKTQ